MMRTSRQTFWTFSSSCTSLNPEDWACLKLTTRSVLEQPLKIPFVAAVVLYANDSKSEVAQDILSRVGAKAQTYLDAGNWRELKLLLRFFACLHNVFEGDGIFPLLDELFNRAVDLQAASQEDVRSVKLLCRIQLTVIIGRWLRTGQDHPAYPTICHRLSCHWTRAKSN